MKKNAPKSSKKPQIALLGLVIALSGAAFWALGDEGQGGAKVEGGAEERTESAKEELYSGPMPSGHEPDSDEANGREAVVTPFFGVVLDATSKEPVPYLDLLAIHWADGEVELPTSEEEKLRILTRISMGAKNREYTVKTDKYGRFEVPLRGMRGHLALKATDGPEARRVPMKKGFCLWLEELPEDLAVEGSPIRFTAAIGPTLAVNLTPPGQLKISSVLESTKLAARGEGPLFFAYLDMRADTRQGVDWHQVRYDVHPVLNRIYVDAFTDQGFPERVSHTAGWIRLPEAPAAERAPGGQRIRLHVQDEEGLLAGSGVVPSVQGIQAKAIQLALTRRGVIEGRVVNTKGYGVPGQRIQLRSLELNEFPFVRGKGERLKTNAAGEFRIECVSEGDWQLQAWGGSGMLDEFSDYKDGVGVPLLLNLAPEIGASKEVELKWGVPMENRNEVRLVIMNSDSAAAKEMNSKLRILERNALFDIERESKIGAALRPVSGALVDVVPTIPVTASFDGHKGWRWEFLLAYPDLPPGTYEVLLPSALRDGEIGVVWEAGSTPWSAGGDPLEIQGVIAPPPSARPWEDPITGQPAEIDMYMWTWWDRRGPVSGWGLENSPDGEPELILRDGNKVTAERLSGQRLVGLGKNLAPVIEPKPRPFTEDLIEVSPMQAKAGWGAVVVVSIQVPSPDDFSDFGEMELPKDSRREARKAKRERGKNKGSATLGPPLPGAKILVDGAFATRTDGMGTAILAADIPPARIVIGYPGYHMLPVPEDQTFLPLEAPPIGQLVYRVVMVRD